jgi:putative ATPase
MDLFSAAPVQPLAERLRPITLAEVVGQQHLLGPGKPLRLAFDARKLHSFVLWGPPGVGKTTIARLAARATDAEFITLSAVLAGVKDIREAAERAQQVLNMRGRQTILFIDEIHRFSKSQQDALLPHTESGLVTLIGGTTEQVGFALNNALLSRMQVYQLKPLADGEVDQLLARAQNIAALVPLAPEAQALLRFLSDGDGRKALGLYEVASTAAQSAGHARIEEEFLRDASATRVRSFDQSGDLLEQISALQKCIRGSDPNAALYWLARLLDGGADANYVARRLVVIATEDVGNADPRALQLALNCADAYARLGSPEGDRALAQAAIYLALAPKSNAVYTAWNEARAYVQQDRARPVPLHLRNAPTAQQAAMGYKVGYRYAHDEPNGYAAGENYFPEGMTKPDWYRPVPRGMEIQLGEKMAYLRELDNPI